ncbi:GntR family transcriptional regulator [Herbiconiux sp. 11R-BC]|uniref:GntR family transcriptional regulator n=1 Tax=Herbiconiux sp. 11R-BC TaxID=3111637 RepID=UPI0010F4841A
MPSASTPKDAVASHRIAATLRESILHGDLAPGQRIRQEIVAEEYGTSRIPVREALRVLQADGLVTLVSNSGAWVASLSQQECSEVYQVRERLEPLLLRMSLPGMTDEIVAELDSLATSMELNNDVETFIRLDRQFHLLSYSTADSTLVSGMIAKLWNTTQHYRRAFSRLVGIGGSAVTHMEHHLLVDAIRRRDGDDAERLLLSHIRRTRLELARHPEIFAPPAA